MSKYFEALRNARTVLAIVVICALLVLVLTMKYYPGLVPSRTVVGVVQSSGIVPAAGENQDGLEVATIQLADGDMVLADVIFGGPLSRGDVVTLTEQPRLLNSPNYEVMAKSSR